ncbi:hypothetical protein HN51_004734 [Arachis hypogaea]
MKEQEKVAVSSVGVARRSGDRRRELKGVSPISLFSCMDEQWTEKERTVALLKRRTNEADNIHQQAQNSGTQAQKNEDAKQEYKANSAALNEAVAALSSAAAGMIKEWVWVVNGPYESME